MTAAIHSRIAGLAMLSAMVVAVACSDSPPGQDTGGDAARDAAADTSLSSDGARPDTSPSSDTALPDGAPTDSSDGPPLAEQPLADGALGDGELDGPRADFGADDAPPDNARSDGAGLDGALPDADAASCPTEPVWRSDSMGFTLANRSIPSGSSPPGADCGTTMHVYEFDAAMQTLSQMGCVNLRGSARLTYVDSIATAQILNALRAMRTVCPSTCLPVSQLETLAVRDAAGCVQQSYDTSGCDLGIPPVVARDDVTALLSLLERILANPCGADGGSSNGEGCSQPADATNLCKTSRRPPVDAGADARLDSPPDGPRDAVNDALADARAADGRVDGDGATCVAEPVGRDFNSLYVTLNQSPHAPPPPPDGGCSGTTMTYEVSLQTKTMLAYGCLLQRDTFRHIELVDTQIDAIVAQVAPLQTTCDWHCGGDDVQGGLSFGDCKGTLLGSFSGNYSPYCNLSPPPPYIESSDLSGIGVVLSSIAFRTCDPRGDAGSTGACTPRCREIIR
jgi:hypothetical protein